MIRSFFAWWCGPSYYSMKLESHWTLISLPFSLPLQKKGQCFCGIHHSETWHTFIWGPNLHILFFIWIAVNWDAIEAFGHHLVDIVLCEGPQLGFKTAVQTQKVIKTTDFPTGGRSTSLSCSPEFQITHLLIRNSIWVDRIAVVSIWISCISLLICLSVWAKHVISRLYLFICRLIHVSDSFSLLLFRWIIKLKICICFDLSRV